jgi:electron transfer flavoprotein beta subunit
VTADGREILELPLPALVTVSNEIGEPRYPSIRGIREASKKEIPTWNAQVIAPAKPLNKMLSVFVPTRESECQFITGETSEEAGINLALTFKKDKLI